MQQRVKPGVKVVPKGLSQEGVVLREDSLNVCSPRSPGEKVWYVRFFNGTEGGGWRDGELIPLQ